MAQEEGQQSYSPSSTKGPGAWAGEETRDETKEDEGLCGLQEKKQIAIEIGTK